MTSTSGAVDGGTVLSVEDLRVYFYTRSGVVRAVDGIDLDIAKGEAVGLVGESGSGKSQTALAVMGLTTAPGRVESGRIVFNGVDLRRQSAEAIRNIRGRDIAMIFQDPMSSLNPVLRVGEQVADGMRVHLPGRRRIVVVLDELLALHRLRRMTRKIKARVVELFRRVRIPGAGRRVRSFPHEFSGGQRQRLAIARGLALHPKMIVLDEPVSALDVSIRAQIMNLLKDLQKEYEVSYMLIAHHLATVRYMCDWVAVMYLGQIVEYADVRELFNNPLHPYTKALMSAALPSHPDIEQDEIILTGEVPSPLNPPSGCRFHTRCPFAMDRCAVEVPETKEVAPGHTTSCHLY